MNSPLAPDPDDSTHDVPPLPGKRRRTRLSELVKLRLEGTGYSKGDLAQVVGVSPQTLSRYLYGDLRMPPEICAAMARVLRMTDEQARELRLAAEVTAGSDELRAWIEELEAKELEADLCLSKVDRASALLSQIRAKKIQKDGTT